MPLNWDLTPHPQAPTNNAAPNKYKSPAESPNQEITVSNCLEHS